MKLGLFILGNLFILSACQDQVQRMDMIVTEIKPTAGMVGTVVTIKGKEFSADEAENYVFLNHINAEVISATPEEIKFIVPNGVAFGRTKLTISRSGFVDVMSWFYISEFPHPRIFKIKPEAASVGDLITIYGENLGQTENENLIFFNDKDGHMLPLTKEQSPVAPFAPLEFANSDSIGVRVPEGAATGAINLWVHPSNADENTLYKTSVPITLNP